MQFKKHISIKDLADYQHTIRHLKIHDADFAELFDNYHDLDSQIQSAGSAEKNNSTVKDGHIRSFIKRRIHFKNKILEIIDKLN